MQICIRHKDSICLKFYYRFMVIAFILYFFFASSQTLKWRIKRRKAENKNEIKASKIVCLAMIVSELSWRIWRFFPWAITLKCESAWSHGETLPTCVQWANLRLLARPGTECMWMCSSTKETTFASYSYFSFTPCKSSTRLAHAAKKSFIS